MKISISYKNTAASHLTFQIMLRNNTRSKKKKVLSTVTPLLLSKSPPSDVIFNFTIDLPISNQLNQTLFA